MDTEILEDLGFTNAEIKVYIALLELGSSTAGNIIERSGLQSSVVHMTLKKLLDKGLISYVKEGKWHHYQASDPSHILEYIDEKKRRFNEMLPQLLAKQRTAKEKREVTVFRGIRGIKELLYELLDAGGNEHHTFGSTSASLMLGKAWWIDYHEKRAKKGIKAKLLFNDSLRPWKAEFKYKNCEVRYTQTGFEPLTETIIRNDSIGLIIWTEKPIGILIHNRIAAESYDKFFSIMWKMSEI
ncbi:MAG: hypothetical protein GXO64_03890 [Candidatus Micrarchaeota archaeon]|nr:hypothetical protein [Candidatus Micrarchaeota archaeon]